MPAGMSFRGAKASTFISLTPRVWTEDIVLGHRVCEDFGKSGRKQSDTLQGEPLDA